MMKRPGLYAVHGILKQMRFVSASYSDLAKSTPGVRNRGDYRAYLELLLKLGWANKLRKDVPSTSVRGALQHKWKSVEIYEITSSGKGFLELFPSQWDQDAAKKIIPRPGLFEIRTILQEISENSIGGITSFSFLRVDEPAVVKNRRNCIRYLKLLRALGWLQIKQQPYDRDYYETTEKGEAFLRLFPKDFTVE